MGDRCKITCSGRCRVGKWWQTTAQNGLNRLYYINGGNGGYVKGGKRIPFEKGKLYFIPFYANITTYTDLRDELDHTYAGIILTPPVFSTDVFCLDPDTSSCVKSAVECFKDICQAEHVGGNEATLLKSICSYLINAEVETSPTSVIKDETVLLALDTMHSSEMGRFNIVDVAKKCHMSTNGFIKKFTRWVGQTPYSYYKSLRLRIARTLRSEGATLEETALVCGYSDGSALLHALASSDEV